VVVQWLSINLPYLGKRIAGSTVPMSMTEGMRDYR
jgi:hypothetical protein